MNNSIWLNNIEIPKFSSLYGDIKTDVLVIGGGITGILTAYYLKNRGIDCVLVEKNRILNGVTSGTTGKITAQHGLIYSKLLENEGVAVAQGYLKANLEAVEEYKKICGEINCDFEICDNIVYSTNSKYELEEEIYALEKIGYSANLNIPFENFGGVRFSKQAQFHPLKFLKEIVKQLKIFENTMVLDVHKNVAVTNNGKISADKIIVATHFPFIDRYGAFFIKLYQNRSLGVTIKGNYLKGEMFVSSDEKGFSLRQYKDNLMIIGSSHRTGKNNGGFENLRDFASKYYGNSKTYFNWGAQDCISLDGMPYVGTYSKFQPNLLVATGFNKWGITGSMVAARLLCDLCEGKTNEFSEIFSPARSILKPQLFINGFESVTNLLNPFGKRCSHLGCKLKWNKHEHSWDCACHGSRFDKDGNVLNNPANKKSNRALVCSIGFLYYISSIIAARFPRLPPVALCECISSELQQVQISVTSMFCGSIPECIRICLFASLKSS